MDSITCYTYRMKVHVAEDGVTDASALATQARALTPYLERLHNISVTGGYTEAESSMNLPFDDELLRRVQAVTNQVTTASLRYIFVVGIGGSNLGTKAVYDALYGYRDFNHEGRPRIIFVDTVNAVYLRYYTEVLIPTLHSADEYLFVTISKSGGTTETLANTEILLLALRAQCGDTSARTVIITDEGSAFAESISSTGVTILTMPKIVGGRYSVFSAVSLLPLAVLGVDIKSLRAGAQVMREQCLSTDVTSNPAALTAAKLYSNYHNHKRIHDTFVFNSELESLGKWYRQLLGESIGKEKNKNGEVVHTGITPTVSIGSTDLHSVAQLYLGGPNIVTTTFVYCPHTTKPLSVPTSRAFPEVVTMINGQDTEAIMSAIYEGTKIAYTRRQRSFIEVSLDAINPSELGAFMQYQMLTVMYLGYLLKVNPFDQPSVEEYKQETKRLLTEGE
jgi:glucose-6-phosphate isomerase